MLTKHFSSLPPLLSLCVCCNHVPGAGVCRMKEPASTWQAGYAPRPSPPLLAGPREAPSLPELSPCVCSARRGTEAIHRHLGEHQWCVCECMRVRGCECVRGGVSAPGASELGASSLSRRGWAVTGRVLGALERRGDSLLERESGGRAGGAGRGGLQALWGIEHSPRPPPR